ncbi:cytochrome P450 [Nostoc sp. CENA543]|uniref:cytochrome P450 n=1 Tax=Nostoc sp. CENA543 TaxID=1869241 RepID=UPI000CA0D310|nr:cytochrome P450 [Nostoc sp. CENA543]AUS99559.1 cytochrome P450 [Nostoc sp. CENA543]
MKIPEVNLPLWLNIIKIANNPLNHLDAISKKYGNIFIINFGETPIVFVSEPQAIKQIFTNTKDIKTPGELNAEAALITGNQGILQLDGLRHKHRRKLMMPAFHGVKMQAQGKLICHLTKQVIDEYLAKKTFTAYPTIEDITLQVSMKVVLGLQEGERYAKLKYLLPTILKSMRSPIMQTTSFLPFLQKDLGKWSPWGYLMHLRQEIFELLYAEVQERRQQADTSRSDILSELIFARDETGELMTDEEVRDLLLSPLFAAQDASAVAITWLLYWVYRQPQVREKLQQELATLGDSPDPMSIAQLPYLSAVCNEVLRIYPAQLFTFPRRVESPIELMGYELAPGTLIMGCIYLTHQQPDLYPNPQQFQPERFLEKQYTPYEFFPFGGGTRSCIGAALAIFEMKLILATILSNYELALVKKQPEQPKFEGLMCYPASGVKMHISAKTPRPSAETSAPLCV